jgi:hypothetical protein
MPMSSIHRRSDVAIAFPTPDDVLP